MKTTIPVDQSSVPSLYLDEPSFLAKTKETLITTFGLSAESINKLDTQTLLFLGHRIADTVAATSFSSIDMVGDEPIVDEKGNTVTLNNILAKLIEQSIPVHVLNSGAIETLKNVKTKDQYGYKIAGTFDVTSMGNANDIPTKKKNQGGDILLLSVMNTVQKVLNEKGNGEFVLIHTSGDEFIIFQKYTGEVSYEGIYSAITDALKMTTILSRENGKIIAKPAEIHAGKSQNDNPYLNTDSLFRDSTLASRKARLIQYIPTRDKRGIEKYLTAISGIGDSRLEQQLVNFLEDSIYDEILFNKVREMERICNCSISAYTMKDKELFWEVMDKKSGEILSVDTVALMKLANDNAEGESGYKFGNTVVEQQFAVLTSVLQHEMFKEKFQGRRINILRSGAMFDIAIDGATAQELDDLKDALVNEFDTAHQTYSDLGSPVDGYPWSVGFARTKILAKEDSSLSVFTNAQNIQTDALWTDQLARLGSVFGKDVIPEKYLAFIDDVFNPNDLRRGLRRLTFLRGGIINVANERALYTSDRSAFQQEVIGLLTGKIAPEVRQSPILNSSPSVRDGVVGENSQKAGISASTQRIEPSVPSGVPVPLTDNSIDPLKLQAWIDAHPDDSKEIARFISPFIRQISFKEFFARISDVASDFASKIGNEPYVIVTTQTKKTDIPEVDKVKSDQWIVELVKPQLPKNYTIVPLEDLRSWMMEHPDTTNILFLDDGSYSGIQIAQNAKLIDLDSFSATNDVTVYIGVPFMTTQAEQKLAMNPIGAYEHVTIVPLVHEKLLSIRDIIDTLPEEARQNFLQRAKAMWTKFYDRVLIGDMTVTYFQHKMPDMYSFPDDIASGRVMNTSGQIVQTLLFIPKTREPYKFGYMEWVEQLHPHTWRERLSVIQNSVVSWWGRSAVGITTFFLQYQWNLPAIIFQAIPQTIQNGVGWMMGVVGGGTEKPLNLLTPIMRKSASNDISMPSLGGRIFADKVEDGILLERALWQIVRGDGGHHTFFLHEYI